MVRRLIWPLSISLTANACLSKSDDEHDEGSDGSEDGLDGTEPEPGTGCQNRLGSDGYEVITSEGQLWGRAHIWSDGAYWSTDDGRVAFY